MTQMYFMFKVVLKKAVGLDKTVLTLTSASFIRYFFPGISFLFHRYKYPVNGIVVFVNRYNSHQIEKREIRFVRS